jgi:hypothetical protein
MYDKSPLRRSLFTEEDKLDKIEFISLYIPVPSSALPSLSAGFFENY